MIYDTYHLGLPMGSSGQKTRLTSVARVTSPEPETLPPQRCSPDRCGRCGGEPTGENRGCEKLLVGFVYFNR